MHSQEDQIKQMLLDYIKATETEITVIQSVIRVLEDEVERLEGLACNKKAQPDRRAK